MEESGKKWIDKKITRRDFLKKAGMTGAGAVVVADVPSDVTVVGVPAKIVRVHGEKDEPTIHEVEEKREYYLDKLEHAREASHHSSEL